MSITEQLRCILREDIVSATTGSLLLTAETSTKNMMTNNLNWRRIWVVVMTFLACSQFKTHSDSFTTHACILFKQNLPTWIFSLLPLRPEKNRNTNTWVKLHKPSFKEPKAEPLYNSDKPSPLQIWIFYSDHNSPSPSPPPPKKKTGKKTECVLLRSQFTLTYLLVG